jgi:hypothetical protein
LPTATLFSLIIAASSSAQTTPPPVPTQARPTAPSASNLAAERALAVTVSEPRMVETVRRLVGFGPRMYGTPSNHESAAWLAESFKQAGLDVQIRQDTPSDWYQPLSWEIRVTGAAAAAGPAAPAPLVLKTTWPNSGAPSGKGGRGRFRSGLPGLPQPDARDDRRLRGCPGRHTRVCVGLAHHRAIEGHVDDSGVCRVASRSQPAS